MDEEAKLRRWRETTEALLGAVDKRFCQPYSICIVPDELRKWNEDAYAPNVVSVGPRYKGRRELLQMEEIKWRCMLSLLNRTKQDAREGLETCMQAMLELDAAVRASYGEEIKLDRYDLATIMVYDGCFLLELLVSGSREWNLRLECRMLPPGPGAEVGKMAVVLSDLTLLENQIPLFILYKLFQLLFPQLDANKFGVATYVSVIEDLALSLFGYSLDSSSNSPRRLINATHFLELAHSFVQENNQQCQQHLSVAVDISKPVELNRCATRLQAAGVTIKRETNSVFPIFKSSKFNLGFNNNDGVLEIPALEITQTTEAKWRNFIAWEHHRKKWKKTSCVGGEVFTFSALLFNDLICCASDVQLLKNREIIVDHLSVSNHDLVDLFRSIANGVDRGVVDSGHHHSNLIDALNAYSATNCVIRFPVMLWHYLSQISEWIYHLHKFLRRGYNFAAALITLLTVIQTFYAVLSYHHPN
ncbi:UPF0481 protein [Spatholobus suberectus]|nr:UPF0481 protein [Spatholobus suberectus]